MFFDVQLETWNLKFFPQSWHFQPDLYDYPCGKYMCDNALSNVWKVFQEKTEKTEHLQKKAPNFFCSQVKDIIISKIFQKIQNLN